MHTQVGSVWCYIVWRRNQTREASYFGGSDHQYLQASGPRGLKTLYAGALLHLAPFCCLSYSWFSPKKARLSVRFPDPANTCLCFAACPNGPSRTRHPGEPDLYVTCAEEAEIHRFAGLDDTELNGSGRSSGCWRYLMKRYRLHCHRSPSRERCRVRA